MTTRILASDINWSRRIKTQNTRRKVTCSILTFRRWRLSQNSDKRNYRAMTSLKATSAATARWTNEVQWTDSGWAQWVSTEQYHRGARQRWADTHRMLLAAGRWLPATVREARPLCAAAAAPAALKADWWPTDRQIAKQRLGVSVCGTYRRSKGTLPLLVARGIFSVPISVDCMVGLLCTHLYIAIK